MPRVPLLVEMHPQNIFITAMLALGFSWSGIKVRVEYKLFTSITDAHPGRLFHLFR